MSTILVCNPLTDAEFTGLVQRLVDGRPGSAGDLQAQLRERYPRAVVRRRVLAGELDETWYVYREGLWIPPGT